MEAHDRELQRLSEVKEQYRDIDVKHEVRSDIVRIMSNMSVEELVQLKCKATEIATK